MFVIKWIRKRIRVKKRKIKPVGQKKYLAHKEMARALVMQKIAQWNAFYKFKIGRVSIRNSKSRWGSCSSKGNLNFNYKISFLPEHLADYVVVHELCHLGEFNHSQKFWALVAEAVPDFEKMRGELKKVNVRGLS